jgi:hypothetical protein
VSADPPTVTNAERGGSKHLTSRRAAAPGKASPPAAEAPKTKPGNRRSSKSKLSADPQVIELNDLGSDGKGKPG